MNNKHIEKRVKQENYSTKSRDTGEKRKNSQKLAPDNFNVLIRGFN